MPGRWPGGNSMSTPGPVIWMTRPTVVGAAIALVWSRSSVARSERPGARRDLDHLTRDVGLADLVIGERQVLDQLLGVLRRILHGHHAGRLLRGRALEDRLVEPGGDVARQELAEHDAGRRLEDELAGRGGGSGPGRGRWVSVVTKTL